jgi:hypothetical protein
MILFYDLIYDVDDFNVDGYVNVSLHVNVMVRYFYIMGIVWLMEMKL